MSRRSRPLRHVRGADRDRVEARLRTAIGTTRRDLADLVRVDRFGGTWWAERCARALGTRPSIVRRVLLGRVVSARAVQRLLEAARPS